MKLLKQAFFTLLFLACFLTIKAQTPSHIKLGEEELSGIDIYDMIQDHDHNYWLATDNGLIKYDGYTFKKIPSVNALSNSVFDLKLDYNNNLFCNNLSGQIFQIINDTSIVYFQIPDSLMYKNVHYAFNNSNELVIATNAIFKVNKHKSITLLSNSLTKNSSYSDLITLKDSSILLHHLANNSLIKIKNDQLLEERINDNSTFLFLNFLILNNELQYLNRKTSEFLMKTGNSFSVNNQFSPSRNKDEGLRYYSDNQLLWVARQAGGIMAYDKYYKPLFGNNTIFKNNIISTVFKDNEGNILLGTFGSGLIVIPNTNLIDEKISNKEVKYTRITSGPNNSLLLGTQNGNVFNLDSNKVVSNIWDKQNKNIELLEYIPGIQTLLIDGNNTCLYHLPSKIEKKLNWGAIKNIIKISENNYLFSSSSGVYDFNLLNYQHKAEPIKNFNSRTNCIGYNPKTKTLYAGTTSGLKIGNTTKAEFYSPNDSPIICKDILYHKNKIYINSQKKGILIFKDDTLVESWNVKNGFPTNNLRHIKVHNDHLFISTDLGIIISNLKGEILSILNKSVGLYTNSIIDFEIKNDVLWVIHQKGVQSININSIPSYKLIPNVSLTKVLINDSLISTNNNSFSYLQNKFEFYVSSNSIKYKDEIQYQHQLVGIDNGWQINNYNKNKIEYKSLPPGDYSFELKVTCRNIESETIKYHFTITPPLWKTWWFYIFAIVIIITISYLIFKREIKKQQKKLQLKNELNTSKLIAIQSQMNPHFIFNAINSIQDLILKGDIDNSYNYIIKFAKLVRQTLNFSDKEFIDIEAEIELLEIYLELEKLRFKDDFEYSINCNLDDIKVPPMLVQPFVENAIKHGLLHKDGPKKLSITFDKDEILNCTVIDNGIGRKKAQEIKARQQKNHQSFSVNATKSRFKIMKSHYQQDLGLLFEDLEENGTPSGTKVVINMPFKQNY